MEVRLLEDVLKVMYWKLATHASIVYGIQPLASGLNGGGIGVMKGNWFDVQLQFYEQSVSLLSRTDGLYGKFWRHSAVIGRNYLYRVHERCWRCNRLFPVVRLNFHFSKSEASGVWCQFLIKRRRFLISHGQPCASILIRWYTLGLFAVPSFNRPDFYVEPQL